MAWDTHVRNVRHMTLTSHDPDDRHVRALDARQVELEQRVDDSSAAVGATDGLDPSLGRELDAAHSLLAQVRAERALLLDDETADAR
jgi:hypothetical protein